MRNPNRFWSHVKKTDSCWLWTGSRDAMGKGYGRFTINGNLIRAHRYSWELANGPIPEGLHVLHNCPGGDNKTCVNPAHLFLGTQLDNISDGVVKGQYQKGERHKDARLSPKEIRSIRALYGTGPTMRELGARFGVSNVTIYKIVHKRTWRMIKE